MIEQDIKNLQHQLNALEATVIEAFQKAGIEYSLPRGLDPAWVKSVGGKTHTKKELAPERKTFRKTASE